MNVAIGSAFRNIERGVPFYLNRVQRLARFLRDAGHTLRVIAVEGDSTDRTREVLGREALNRGIDLDLITCNHGGPVFGSTEAPERMVALSKVGNAIFDGVRETDDALVYVECDLQWEAEDILILLVRATEGPFDVVAPMVMAGEAFYDIWGFRDLDGHRFGPIAPFHSQLTTMEPMEIGSAGSCLVMSGVVARNVRIRNDYCLVGWCEDARSFGFRIAVYPDVKVRQA